MKKSIETIGQFVDSLALDAVMLDPDDIPKLGGTLKSIEALEKSAGEIGEKSLLSVTAAMKGFIESVILRETSDLSPFEKGVCELQKLCKDLSSGKEPETSDLSFLKGQSSGQMNSDGQKPEPGGNDGGNGESDPEAGRAASPDGGDGKGVKTEETGCKLADEDREIVFDFVTESLDNLRAIEVKLMDLEQDPTDVETINAIFRPFHTIKGVSGFLNFGKINRLAHISENLLDKARNDEILIDREIVDVILESLDMLKIMIESVRESLNEGYSSEGDTDIAHVAGKIETLLEHSGEKEAEAPLGEILVQKGLVSDEDLEGALELQKQNEEKKIGEILVDQKKIRPNDIDSALKDQKKSVRQAILQVKVDTLKLDNVVDMVGELAIAQSMLRQNEAIVASKDRSLDQTVNQLNQLISGLQKTAMSLRMVPIKSSFQKMLRLVRDLARKAGKDVRLVMSGEDTEIDRNMVEEIYDPIVHMIRNSIDHGLETSDEREAAGKPRQGTVSLKAYHKGGDIVIEIGDDGKGLNREKILKKAVSSGLIGESEKLSDEEIHNLIFHPGLSTAEKITDISGRGVGMDVVKSRIVEKLRGRVDVHSSEGEGSTFYIRLPLTLAIIDGMIVRVGDERYVIPTLAIQESFRPKKEECRTVKGKGEMIMFRDHLVPLIRLHKLFDLGGKPSSNGKNPAWEKLVVVVENRGKRRCLLIDELIGQDEIVIKSLGGELKHTKGIAGAAIMGDGTVGLILDISGIFSMFSEEP